MPRNPPGSDRRLPFPTGARLALALALPVWGVATAGPEAARYVPAAVPARCLPSGAASLVEPERGLEIELRIWHARIAIRWLDELSLLSPGYRVVISFPAGAGGPAAGVR
jgi:hypothetical protein